MLRIELTSQEIAMVLTALAIGKGFQALLNLESDDTTRSQLIDKIVEATNASDWAYTAEPTDRPNIERVFRARVDGLLFVGIGSAQKVLPEYIYDATRDIGYYNRDFASFWAEMGENIGQHGLTTLINVSGASQDWQTLDEVIELHSAWKAKLDDPAPEEDPFQSQ